MTLIEYLSLVEQSMFVMLWSNDPAKALGMGNFALALI